MEKLKSCSFYFVSKFIIKKYFIFLFATVVFIANGFFISPAFASTTIDTDITEDTTWTLDGSPYIVTTDIFVFEGATLTIQPGVVVKFNPGTWPYLPSLYIFGKIVANGTKNDPIYFTSNYDDNVGGSTDDDFKDCYYENYDENGNPLGEEICEIIDWYEPYVGDWDGINFISSIGSNFKNVFFRYADDALSFESSSVNFENLNINDSSSGLTGDTNSNIEILGGTFNNLEDAFTFYDNSSLQVQNISVTNVENGFTGYNSFYYLDNHESSEFFDNSSLTITDSVINSKDYGISVFNKYSLTITNSPITSENTGIEIFNDSSATIIDSDITCGNNGIEIFNDSLLNFSGGNISCFNDGIIIFNGVIANIDDVKITDSLDAGIIAFTDGEPNQIIVTNSEITGNEYGFEIFDSTFSAHENNIHDNFTSGADTFTDILLDFTSNFWGDASGPTHSSNPTGLGDAVSDNILFAPFLTEDPLVEVLEVRHPVILIPGITGTYLIRDYGDKKEIWPDISRNLLSLEDLFLNDLALEIDGTENIEMPIKAGDIIRGITLPVISDIHVFDRLISELIDNGGYVEGEDLFVFPYDWRTSTSQNAVLLKEKIDKILLDTEYENVDIVAHSMGGLIAKKYIINNGQDKIDQLIFLGTPQLGAPKAFKALMFGDNMGYGIAISDTKKISVLNAPRVKYISQNMPSVYELLPSEKYIENNGSYVTNALNKDIAPIDLNYEQTGDFMIEKGRNVLMFPFAKDLHDSIDDLDLSGIETHNFVGCGTKTIGEITVKQKRSWKSLFFGWVEDINIKYVNGDETVPLESANKTIGANIYFAKGNTHGSLPSAEGVRQNVLSILTGEELEDYSNILDDVSTCNISGDVVSTHSPVELHIYDEGGNHTGPNSDGDIEYGVIGVQYDVIDEENYAFLPDGVNYKIVTKATDTGGYNFMIEEQSSNDIITATYNWTLIPLNTLNTQGEIWIGPDYSPNEYEVKIDEDGDGTIDENYQSSYDGTAEAERATAPHRKFSSGSIPQISLIPVTTIQNLEIKTPVLESVQEKQELVVNTVTITDIDKGESINKEKVKDFSIKREITKDDNIEQNNLSASVGNSGVKVNLIWPATILSGFIIILLAKKFLKL